MSAAIKITQWKSHERSIPRELLKCGLFAVKSRKSRTSTNAKESVVIFHEENKQGTSTLSYSGWGVNQEDLDVYLELLEFAKGSKAGEKVYFKRSELLHALGWPMQTKSRLKLIACLEHLKKTTVTGNVIRSIGNNETIHKQVDFSLISESSIYITDEDGGSTKRVSRDWWIVIPHNVTDMGKNGGLARIDTSERKAFSAEVAVEGKKKRSQSGKSLAKFLHAYLSSNKYDARFTPDAKEIHKLSGSTRKKLKDFKAQELRAAIDCINEANISYKVCINQVTGRLYKIASSDSM